MQPAAGIDVRCPRCGAILPKHYPPCRETRLSMWGTALWAGLGIPIAMFTIGTSHVHTAVAVAASWGLTYIALRFW